MGDISAAIRAEPRQIHVIPLARDAKRRLAFVVYAVYFGAVVEAQPHQTTAKPPDSRQDRPRELAGIT